MKRIPSAGPWPLIYGLSHVADGLVLLVSLGTYSTNFTLSAALKMAQYRRRRREKAFAAAWEKAGLGAGIDEAL